MQKHVTRINRLTSEPSEHSIGNMRAITHKFLVSDMVDIPNKLNRVFVDQFNGLTTVQDNSSTGRYTATQDGITAAHSQERTSGMVEIETDPKVIERLKETINWSVAQELLPGVLKI